MIKVRLLTAENHITTLFWQELEGMVTVPGNDKDVQIADIPIVTAITTDSQDIYVKPISPMQVHCTGKALHKHLLIVLLQGQWQYHHSSCSSPETATSLEANQSCPATDRDHMYSQSHSPTSAIIAENKHLKGMLMAHLDIIQQQSETILSKDKLLKSLREETGLLRQKLLRMTRRLRPGEEGGGGRRVAGSGRRGGERPIGGEEKRGRKRELDRGSAVSLGQERPSKRQSRVPDTQEEVEEVHGGEMVEDVEEESEDQSLPDTPLPEHRVAALPVTVDSVDELRDEFCMQTSPELPRAMVRRRIGEEEEEEEDTRLGPTPGKGKGGVGRKKGRTSLDKEAKEGGSGRKGRGSLSSTIAPPTPLVPALTTSNLYYVGCRNDQQV